MGYRGGPTDSYLARLARTFRTNATGTLSTLAWLWPLAETKRKAIRTFSTVLTLMERYPGYRFSQSMAQLYALVEGEDEELFGRIRKRVAGGEWEPSVSASRQISDSFYQ
jgi:alpha-mannosidase